MFQKAIKEEFSKFDFTNVNNKNEIKEIISCNVHVSNYSNVDFIFYVSNDERYKEALKKNKILYKSLQLIEKETILISSFMNLLDENDLKTFKYEVNNFKKVVLNMQIDSVLDELYDSTLKKSRLKKEIKKIFE